MRGETVAALVGALVVGGFGVGFVWLGRRMIAGRIDPNLGHRNVENTTPESWHATRTAIGKAIAGCGWTWVLAAIVLSVLAPAGVVAGVALLTIASVWLVVQIARAAKLLTPLAG